MFESVRQTVEREKLRLRYQEQESAKWSVGSADAVQINEQERILAELKRQLGRKTEEIKEINAENASLQTRLAEEQRIREPGDDDSNELISQLEATIKNLTLRVNEIEAENRKLQTKYSSDTTMREGRDNNERVGQGLWGLRTGLTHFVSRRFVTRYPGGEALRELRRIFPDGPEREELEQEAQFGNRYFDWMDAAALLKVVASSWSDVFRQHFKPAERDCVHDLRRVRNNWAHQRPFSNDKAYHALDSMHRLLSAMGASQAREIDNLKVEQFKVTSNGQISQIVSGPSSPVGAVR